MPMAGHLRLSRDKRARSVSLDWLDGGTFRDGAADVQKPVRLQSLDAPATTKGLDVDHEFRCILHMVRQVEKYLRTSVCTGSLESVTDEDLQTHLAVQETIEKLVYRLSELRAGFGSNLTESGQREEKDIPASSTSADTAVIVGLNSSGPGEQVGQTAPIIATGKFRRLEKRLHQCWLKSLERHCVLEEILRGNIPPIRFVDGECRESIFGESVEQSSPKFIRLSGGFESFESVSLNKMDSPSEPADSAEGSPSSSGMKLSFEHVIGSDVGYGSEGSMNHSNDDVSPSQPIPPRFLVNESPTRNRVNASVLSDSETPRKGRVANRVYHNNQNQTRSSTTTGSSTRIDASPNEYYYKVAPLALDLRADTLTRSARGSLSRLTRTCASKLAFSDDEEQSKSLRSSRDFLADSGNSGEIIPSEEEEISSKSRLLISSIKARLEQDSASPSPKQKRSNIRSRTLPPEERTSILAAKCEVNRRFDSDPVNSRRQRRRRPWSLILNGKANYPGYVSSSISDGNLNQSCSSSSVMLTESSRRYLTSSSEEIESEDELCCKKLLGGSRTTLNGGPIVEEERRSGGRLWTVGKSKSTSALGKEMSERDPESSLWEDYWDPPYASEAYSENSLDESVIQKITNFGEDYSKLFPVNSVDGIPPHFPVASSRLRATESCLSYESESDTASDASGNHSGVIRQSLQQLKLLQQAALAPAELGGVCQSQIGFLTVLFQHKSTQAAARSNENELCLLKDCLSQWKALLSDISSKQACEEARRSCIGRYHFIKDRVTARRPRNSIIVIDGLDSGQRFLEELKEYERFLQGEKLELQNLENDSLSHKSSCGHCPGTWSLQDTSSIALSIEESLTCLKSQETALNRYLSLLNRAYEKMAEMNIDALPDIIPSKMTDMTELKVLQKMLEELSSNADFILRDPKLLRIVEKIQKGNFFRPEMSSKSSTCSLLKACSDVVGGEEDGMQKEPSTRGRVCLIVGPLLALLVFFGLLAAVFWQPECCSHSRPRRLFELTLEYPKGAPPV